MDTTTKTPKACIGDMFPSVFPGMPMFAYVLRERCAALRSGCRGCRTTGNSSHGMPHHESVLRRGHARAGRCC